MVQLEVKNLNIGYEKKSILSDINFSIEKGDYLCIIGENGAGKSTLLKTLLNLIPKISGEIIFNGGEKGKLAYLPQQNESQKDFPCSVYEVVLSGFEKKKGLRPFFNKNEKEEALKNLERVGIKDFKNKCFNEISIGQKQRVMLARALCATNEILFLDEPVASLDVKITEDMYELIKDLNKQGISIVMITHDKGAIKYANKILYVAGNAFFGTKEEFLKKDILFMKGGSNE